MGRRGGGVGVVVGSALGAALLCWRKYLARLLSQNYAPAVLTINPGI